MTLKAKIQNITRKRDAGVERNARTEGADAPVAPEQPAKPEEDVRAAAIDLIARLHTHGATGHYGGTAAYSIVFWLEAHGFKIVRS